MSTIKQEIISLNDAISNLRLNDIENLLREHESNMKVFSEIKTKEFHERKKALIHSINVFIDDIITETFNENEHKSIISKMETLIKTPGLQHLAENIFLNLNYQEVKTCGLLNETFDLFTDQLIENPFFLLKRFVLGGMSKKNENDWTEIIQKTRGTNIEESVFLYLNQYFKNEKVADFGVPSIIKKVTYGIGNLSIVSQDYYYDEIVKILDPLNYIPNVRQHFGDIPRSPICWAAIYGHTKIVKIMATLSDIPNSWYNDDAKYDNGRTPIFMATCNGHTEIVKILAPLTDNPNAPNNYGETPIYKAAWYGFTEIVRILVPLTRQSKCYR